MQLRVRSSLLESYLFFCFRSSLAPYLFLLSIFMLHNFFFYQYYFGLSILHNFWKEKRRMNIFVCYLLINGSSVLSLLVLNLRSPSILLCFSFAAYSNPDCNACVFLLSILVLSYRCHHWSPVLIVKRVLITHTHFIKIDFIVFLYTCMIYWVIRYLYNTTNVVHVHTNNTLADEYIKITEILLWLHYSWELLKYLLALLIYLCGLLPFAYLVWLLTWLFIYILSLSNICKLNTKYIPWFTFILSYKNRFLNLVRV